MRASRIDSKSVAKGIFTVCLLLVFCQGLLAQNPTSDQLLLSVFDVDATPPVGSLLAYDPMEGSNDLGLRAKGLVLQGNGLPIVLCAVDWIGIGNDSQVAFKNELAKAVGTIPERVAIHTVHQHDAPISDFGAEKLLTDAGLSPEAFEGGWQREFIQNLAQAAKNSMAHRQAVTHLGNGKAEVKRVASNRRIAGPDGKIKYSRTSSTRDPDIRAFPEGLIDPELSLISFWKEEKPLAVLSYYAVHPQSYYLTKKADPDFPGIARYMRQLTVPEALHIHFNGAGGNITAGKYNDGSRENRLALAKRLEEGMASAWDNTVKSPLTKNDVDWRYEQVFLPVNDRVAQIADEMAEKDQRWLTNHVQRLSWKKSRDMGQSTPVSCLHLGNTRILHLPGELFVEYQLWAKNLAPNLQVAMAAYGDYGPFYIGDASAYEAGGYEILSSPTKAEAEGILKEAMMRLLEEQPAIGYIDKTRLFGKDKDFPSDLPTWEQFRDEWKKAMETFMGEVPKAITTLPTYTILDSLISEKFVRYHIQYPSTSEMTVPAYLYIPKQKLKEKLPAVLALHSTGELGKKIVDGQSELENRAVARELAERGYVVLAPDYPSFGDLKDHDFSTDGFESGTMLAIWNHKRGIDLLQSLPYVAPELIGTIGHSLGGHNALFLSAFDQRVKATVSSCGWTPFSHYDIGEEASQRYGGRLGPWAQERYMPRIGNHLEDEELPFDFVHIIGSIAPRALFSSSPKGDSNFSVEGVKEVAPLLSAIYRYFGNPESLKVVYPDAGHDFPSETREAAYHFLDQQLDFTR
ncbi:alpha/beta hydrolase [Pleomorphovibrio marinus]|uniref:alpha/beta hydrolase n=1 Tax=Pleomorphovibrio marinus TaxID=2164132 RepID=UPI001E2C9D0E|nr:alpha/beta fold hydrolase [Pleomorphovibrio marinus]